MLLSVPLVAICTCVLSLVSLLYIQSVSFRIWQLSPVTCQYRVRIKVRVVCLWALTQTCFMTGDIRSLRYITTGYLCHLSESVCPLETYSTLTYCTLTVHSPTVHSPTVHSFMYSIYMLQTLYMCYCSVDFLSVYAQMRSNQLTRSIHQ